MKRAPSALAMLALLACAAPASAAGVNLGWNDCPGGAEYALSQAFACDTNVGIHTLVGSYVAPANVLGVNANEFLVDLETSGANLSDWWSLRSTSPAGCRPTSLLYSFDFTGGPLTCYDYWQGGAVGGVSWIVYPPGATNRARIKGVVALPAGSPLIQPVPEGLEVYSFKLVITNAKTTGLGACAGCADGACIFLTQIRLDQPADVGPAIDIYTPAVSERVTWQPWNSPEPCAGTPVRSPTWGAIKALYR